MAYRVGYSLKERTLMNIPNKITISRVVIVFAMLIALFVLRFIPGLSVPVYGGDLKINLVYIIICAVFIIAAITDKIDGDLARKWNQVTDFGKFLDPVADKLLVTSMLIYLAIPHFVSATMVIPVFCVIIMIVRDLVVDALRLVATTRHVVLAANNWGKAKTVLQMVAIPVVLLNGFPFTFFDKDWGEGRLGLVLVYAATLVSLISGIIYLAQNWKVISLKKEDKHE